MSCQQEEQAASCYQELHKIKKLGAKVGVQATPRGTCDSQNSPYKFCDLPFYAIAIKAKKTLLCQAHNLKAAVQILPPQPISANIIQSNHRLTKAGQKLVFFVPPRINNLARRFKSPRNQQRPDLPTTGATNWLGWSQGGYSAVVSEMTAMRTKRTYVPNRDKNRVHTRETTASSPASGVQGSPVITSRTSSTTSPASRTSLEIISGSKYCIQLKISNRRSGATIR